MNRMDLQQLAELRLRETETLLWAGCWDGAYCLCDYAVECALKACIAKKTREHDFPNKKVVNEIYTHHLKTLVHLAQLETLLKERCNQDSKFESYWTTVKDWREESRYDRDDEHKARAFVEAVEGVLSWLKGHW
jgi:HEPN domain-containing protein